MALISTDQRRSINIVIPTALAGYVFYDAYAKKGKSDWKAALIMCLIVFGFAYLVTTQITRTIAPEDENV